MNSFLSHKLFIVAAMFFVATNVSAQADKLTYTVSDGSATITGFTSGYSSNTLTIPETIGGYNVTAIADGAFFNNTQLTSVTLPSKLTEIGSYAFAGNTQLDTIIIPKSVTTFGEGAFWCCFNLGVGLEDGNTALTMGTGDDAGVLFSTNKDTLYFFPNKFYQRKYQYMVPTSVTRIAAGAFALNSTIDDHVKAVVLPSSLTAIGDFAFNSSIIDGCTSPIQHLTIPYNTTSLGNGCLPNGLQELVLLPNVTQDTQVGGTYLPCSEVENAFTPKKVTIKDGTTIIGGEGIIGVNVYTRSTTYNKGYKDLSLKYSITGSTENSIDTLGYNIPIILPAGRQFISISRDFPITSVSPSTENAAKFWVVYDKRRYTQGTVATSKDLYESKLVRIASVGTIPARGSKGTYLGAIVSAPKWDISTSDRILYYQIGNNEHGSETVYGYDDTFDKALLDLRYNSVCLGAPCPMFVRSDTIMNYYWNTEVATPQIQYEECVAYGLSNNKFHIIGSNGYLRPQKSIVAIPKSWVNGSSGGAKSFLNVVFDDSETTGINNVSTEVKKDTNKWFTLQGVSLSEEPTQPGIYIHNGKKVIIR